MSCRDGMGTTLGLSTFQTRNNHVTMVDKVQGPQRSEASKGFQHKIFSCTSFARPRNPKLKLKTLLTRSAPKLILYSSPEPTKISPTISALEEMEKGERE